MWGKASKLFNQFSKQIQSQFKEKWTSLKKYFQQICNYYFLCSLLLFFMFVITKSSSTDIKKIYNYYIIDTFLIPEFLELTRSQESKICKRNY